MDSKKRSSSPLTGTRPRFSSLDTIQEESKRSNYDQNSWEDFRETKKQEKNLETDDSILRRLENEDVEDPSSTVGYLKNFYNQVIDAELVTYFNDRYDVDEGIADH